jgi:hypothetical protein
MKHILRNYFKRVPENHSTILVLEGADAKKLDDDLQKISTLGDNPNITVNFRKFNSGKGGRKSHRSNSKKNKRTRRKSLKKQQHRRK